MNATYNIIRIEDGVEVPLASEMPNHSLGLVTTASILILVAAVLVFLIIYLVRCYHYRNEIRSLQKTNRKVKKYDYKLSWNLFRLRDLADEIKSYIASSIQVE
jgi:hypothetical protein